MRLSLDTTVNLPIIAMNIHSSIEGGSIEGGPQSKRMPAEGVGPSGFALPGVPATRSIHLYDQSRMLWGIELVAAANILYLKQ